MDLISVLDIFFLLQKKEMLFEKLKQFRNMQYRHWKCPILCIEFLQVKWIIEVVVLVKKKKRINLLIGLEYSYWLKANHLVIVLSRQQLKLQPWVFTSMMCAKCKRFCCSHSICIVGLGTSLHFSECKEFSELKDSLNSDMRGSIGVS